MDFSLLSQNREASRMDFSLLSQNKEASRVDFSLLSRNGEVDSRVLLWLIETRKRMQ